MAAGFKALPSDVEKESESNFFAALRLGTTGVTVNQPVDRNKNLRAK